MTVEALNSIHPFTFNSVRLAPNQTCNLELNNGSIKSIEVSDNFNRYSGRKQLIFFEHHRKTIRNHVKIHTPDRNSFILDPY